MKRLDDVTMILVEAALVAVIVAALFGVAVLHAQTLVLMQRADATQGPQQIECILDAVPDAVQYSSTGLIVRCHSDADDVFHNGFDAL